MLLREAGFTFEQADPPYEDPPQPHVHGRDDACELAADLALNKAQSLAPQLGDDLPHDAVILGADTICIGVNGDLIGQPATREDARAMIRSFTNADHDVVTGIALVTQRGECCTALADVATVTFQAITDQQLDNYLDTSAWQDKAGGYNLTDRQNDGWPITVQGDPTTVVGLPMGRLVPLLARYDITPDLADITDHA